MKLSFRGCFCLCVLYILLPAIARAQNWTNVTATNITDLNQQKLAAGQLCFLATDQNDNPISINVGGGGQLLRRTFCSAIANGAVTAFSVPNPAASAPSGIYYRVTVNDSSLGKEVLRYTQVTFSGTTFSFDNYAPTNLGSFAPLTGNSVSGNLSVSGNVAATGTVTGTNIPASIPGAGTCTNQFVRALTTGAPPTCNTIGSSDLASSLTLAGTTNTGNVIVNPSSTGTGAALTIGGTSSTTGGISVFTGALGAQTERLSVVPADGSSAATRVGSLSVRQSSAGFLTGTEVASISSAGTVTTGTGGVVLPGSTSGTTTLKASAAAGATTATMPANTGTVAETNLAQTWSAAQTHNSGTLVLAGATSGTTILNATSVASGVLTLPAATDTIAVLGTAQTWGATNQNNMQLVTPKIGGETVSSSPRIPWSTFINGNLSIATGVSQFTVDKSITITRLEAILDANVPSGCTTNAVIDVFDQTASTSLTSITLNAQVVDSGALSAAATGGHQLRIRVVTGAVGCTSTPHDANVVVQFRCSRVLIFESKTPG